MSPNALEAVREQAQARSQAAAATAAPTPAAPVPAAPPARRPMRVLQPFVLHSEDDARQWLIDTAANNRTYSSLY
eukprot:SAG11_NODE_32536_length_282_cov_4.409836_1_plen_74_part_10